MPDKIRRGTLESVVGSQYGGGGRKDSMSQSYFSSKVFTFLKELDAHDERARWEQNKDRYIEVIRERAKAFIEGFDWTLQAVSENFVADTRTNGGSLMRPYADRRFSKRLSSNFKTPMASIAGFGV
jgi:uncharacterized protein (DUF2461 family)